MRLQENSPLSSPGWGHAITPQGAYGNDLSLGGGHAAGVRHTPGGTLLSMTPPECQAMLEAVEDAMQLVSASPLGRGVPSESRA